LYYLVQSEFDDCYFYQCTGFTWGGGIYVELWGKHNFSRCIFTNCSAEEDDEEGGFGGGILVRTDPPTMDDVGSIYIKHCYFKDNFAVRESYGDKKDGWGRGYFI
jgi:hypothetical protein